MVLNAFMEEVAQEPGFESWVGISWCREREWALQIRAQGGGGVWDSEFPKPVPALGQTIMLAITSLAQQDLAPAYLSPVLVLRPHGLWRKERKHPWLIRNAAKEREESGRVTPSRPMEGGAWIQDIELPSLCRETLRVEVGVTGAAVWIHWPPRSFLRSDFKSNFPSHLTLRGLSLGRGCRQSCSFYGSTPHGNGGLGFFVFLLRRAPASTLQHDKVHVSLADMPQGFLCWVLARWVCVLSRVEVRVGGVWG